ARASASNGLFPCTSLFRSPGDPPAARVRGAPPTSALPQSRFPECWVRVDGSAAPTPIAAHAAAPRSPPLSVLEQRIRQREPSTPDRKSTRLNSSHDQISYA